MKKALFFLVISIFFIQCSPENEIENKEEQQEKPENLAISVTIEGEVLNENREKVLYISNDEGEIEGQIALQNNEKKTLTIEKEPDTEYHLIVHNINTFNDRTIHDFSIFQNVSSSAYTLKANSTTNSGELPQIDLQLTNTGNFERLGMTGGGSSSLSSDNGGTFTSVGNLLSDPGDYFYSFKKQEEDFARYFWAEDITEDKSFTMNYEDLPASNLVETQLPEHESATVFVYGYRSEYPSAGHSIKIGNTGGMQVLESYIPGESIFDYFSLNLNLFDGTTSYSINSTSEVIPTEIEIPSFDFTINNFSVDDTEYSTTGEYDISSAAFLTSADNTNVQALVKVYSEPGNEISFSITPLVTSLFEIVPSLNTSQLEPLSISMFSYNFREDYQQAVRGFIESHYDRSPGDFSASISRKNN